MSGAEHDVPRLQRQCQRCPLHRNGPVPYAAPLHVPPVGAPLVVMDSPLGAPATPRHDARFRMLRGLVPEVGDFAATYVLTCWSPPGEAPRQRYLDACSFHRRIELHMLAPPLILAIGDAACRLYLGVPYEETAQAAVQHPAGMVVIPLPEELGTLPDNQLQGLRDHCRGVGEAMTLDLA